MACERMDDGGFLVKLIKKIDGKLKYELSKVVKGVYEVCQRRRLKNDNFSIVCSNCIGGIIYNRLGKQFLSPTINLWMHQRDFIKFVLDMRGYLAEELIFIESRFDYPVAKLRDIQIYFAHYHSECEARETWNRRKERVNFENLYIIMYDRDGVTCEDLLKLKEVPCKGRIVLSDQQRNYDGVDYIKTLIPTKNANGKQFVDQDDFGVYTFEKQFDYVQWLNAE